MKSAKARLKTSRQQLRTVSKENSAKSNESKGLAHIVSRYRTEMNMTCEELSRLTDIPTRELQVIEAGRGSAVSLAKLYRLSNYLNIPPSILLAAIHE